MQFDNGTTVSPDTPGVRWYNLRTVLRHFLTALKQAEKQNRCT